MTPLEPANGSSADPARCRSFPGAGPTRVVWKTADRHSRPVLELYGHGEQWWRAFCYRFRIAGYDGWPSIEHEDVMLSRRERLTKSEAFLKSLAPSEASDYASQEF
jgi:hypothetical protein